MTGSFGLTVIGLAVGDGVVAVVVITAVVATRVGDGAIVGAVVAVGAVAAVAAAGALLAAGGSGAHAARKLFARTILLKIIASFLSASRRVM